MRSTRYLLAVAAAAVAWISFVGPAHADLIHHWKFDEAGGTTTAADSGNSVSLLPLTLQGNAAFVNDATRGGQVLDLPTSKVDYARNTSGVPFGTDTTHTVGVWVNYASTGSRYQGLLSWGASGARYFFGTGGVNTGSTTPGRTWAGIGGNLIRFTEADAVPLEDEWQYWTFVREGKAARLYLDGNLLQTVEVAVSGSINPNEELRIGRYFGDFNETAGGKSMDDLAIWNVALTPWQINNAMVRGAENYLIPEPSSAALLSFAVMGMLLGLGSRRRRRVTA